MTVKTKWIQRNNKSDGVGKKNQLKEALMDRFDLSNLTAELLINRGCSSIDEGRRYLQPNTKDLHDPFLFEDMEKVVERFISARAKKEKICLYGDYDADGTIGVSILIKFLKKQGFDVIYFIPNRLVTGYGLHISPLQDLIDEGVTLFVTVDNGISANEQVAFCNEKNIDVIITDHHECHGVLPEAYGIIDPKVPNSMYPFKELCGAGVAFKLIQALSERLNVDMDFQECIECVALATVADIVMLQDENRCLVSLGLNYINNSPQNLGIKALMEVSELKYLKAWHFGFVLGPKINAAGRLGEANYIVDLLTDSDLQKVMRLAEFLSSENRKRQDLELEIFEEALETVDSVALYKEDIMIVVGENWHTGVIGIVASRIQEKHYKPVIVVSIENGIGKASCRSVEGFNIFEALASCDDLFINYGGHDQAAGFSIKKDNIEQLTNRIIEYGKRVDVKKHLIKKIFYDAEIKLEDINWNCFNEMALFEPCGIGNPAIQFALHNPCLTTMKTIGKENNHLSLLFNNGLKGVGFGLGAFYNQYPDFSMKGYNGLELIFRLDTNEFKGNKTLQLMVKDIKINPIWQIDTAMTLVKTIVRNENPKEKIVSLVPDVRIKNLALKIETIRKVYTFLNQCKENGLPINTVCKADQDLSPYHLLMSCEILREAGLVAYGIKNEHIFSKIIRTTEKKDIQNTKLMIKLKKMISDGEGD